MNRAAAALLVVAPALATSAGAQLAEVTPGSRVRFTAPGVTGGRVAGTVLERHGDTLRIGRERGEPFTVSIGQLSRLELGEGKSHADGAVVGALWGGGIFAALGTVVVAAGGASCDGDSCTEINTGGAVALSAFGGAFWGAVIGGVVGRERWQRLALPARLSLAAPQAGGVRVALRLSAAR